MDEEWLRNFLGALAGGSTPDAPQAQSAYAFVDRYGRRVVGRGVHGEPIVEAQVLSISTDRPAPRRPQSPPARSREHDEP